MSDARDLIDETLEDFKGNVPERCSIFIRGGGGCRLEAGHAPPCRFDPEPEVESDTKPEPFDAAADAADALGLNVDDVRRGMVTLTAKRNAGKL